MTSRFNPKLAPAKEFFNALKVSLFIEMKAKLASIEF